VQERKTNGKIRCKDLVKKRVLNELRFLVSEDNLPLISLVKTHLSFQHKNLGIKVKIRNCRIERE